jgi:hypothetical protein
VHKQFVWFEVIVRIFWKIWKHRYFQPLLWRSHDVRQTSQRSTGHVSVGFSKKWQLCGEENYRKIPVRLNFDDFFRQHLMFFQPFLLNRGFQERNLSVGFLTIVSVMWRRKLELITSVRWNLNWFFHICQMKFELFFFRQLLMFLLLLLKLFHKGATWV